MQKINNDVYYSATDLTHFAECAYLSYRDRLDLDQPMPKAADDEQARLIQAKGYAHENAYLARLKAEGRRVVEVPGEAPLAERIALTRAAIASGADVVYQATLVRGHLLGHADFLVRQEGASGAGYEVVDTKLARSPKAKFVLQLSFYTELLSDLLGFLPRYMHVELGDGRRHTFRVVDYFHYYRHLLDRFLAFVGEAPKGSAAPYPQPCEFCPLCHWREHCAQRWKDDDHLSQVAGITRMQAARLEGAGVRTMASLAALPQDAPVPKVAEPTLAKFRAQARLQVAERETGEQQIELLPVAPGEIRGFARLPAPDPGDVFFDMEGDPLEEGGLEYLFGVYFFEAGKAQFRPFWAHDREQERAAFEAFMDFIAERLRRFPCMHIYHYAHYENTALKRLMSLHGVREAEVDQLLREGRLVDLYRVVREALRLSKPSYSIKEIEAYYAGKRAAAVTKATESIVVYERWRETDDRQLLEDIRQYNEDDCRSTWQLREWLLTLRPAGLPWLEADVATPVSGPAKPKSKKTREIEWALADVHHRLLESPTNPALPRELAELTYQLLDFHRRAEKPVWWALFERQEAPLEDLLEDPEVLTGLEAPQWVGSGHRYDIYRYRFPEQDTKLKEGDRARRLDDLRDVKVVALDESACTVDLELKPDWGGEPPATLNICGGAPVPADKLRKALFDFAGGLAEGHVDNKAVTDFLLRRLPEIKGRAPGAPIMQPGEALPQIIDAVRGLKDSYLFIQGPPGAGKTHTGSHVIAALLQAGKRVAVSSNSHKAINHLLEAVDRRMREAGARYFGMKKCASDEHGVESEFIENVGEDKAVIQGRPQLAAGTAWLFAHPELRQHFDYLFIDEAGQVSLANLVAMGLCARNIVLLGDQMQLGQPIQGVHPGRSGESCLNYLLDGEATIAPERGVFLEKTFRMHPDVCRFISDAVYDSRLESDSSTEGQRLLLDAKARPLLLPTGIRFVPVEHDGCSRRSEEEAALIAELVGNLLTQRYRNKQGEDRSITLQDILVVAPYNMQVNLLKRRLPDGARVGTVDKFQGQEAEVVIISMTTSSGEYLPRFMDFLFSKNRLNVAISRARCLSILLANPRLLDIPCRTVEQIALVNTLAAAVSKNPPTR